MIYLTYNDSPSGIYESQVLNVCRFVNASFQSNIRLVAFISIRGFAINKKKIRSKLPDAIVLPMIPKHSNWRLNRYTLQVVLLFIGKQSVWARGVFATTMALDLKKKGKVKKVVFDARGAYASEFSEYLHKIVDVKEDVAALEKASILDTDFRLAVSQTLVDYWKQAYQYTSSDHVVIPCTLSDETPVFLSSEKEITFKRSLGFSPADIVIAYAGSAADWQSMNLLNDFMMQHFSANESLKLLILSTADLKGMAISKKYNQRILQRWVKPTEVMQFLQISDYGFLIRESSITNKVSSPTKFAEYLNAGLNVIISAEIGDFSAFVQTNKCGLVIDDVKKTVKFKSITALEKATNKKLASSFFSKEKYKDQYQQLITIL